MKVLLFVLVIVGSALLSVLVLGLRSLFNRRVASKVKSTKLKTFSVTELREEIKQRSTSNSGPM